MNKIKTETKKILIIDDDIDLLMLLERRLQKEGFIIETAASLQKAEEVLLYFQPHLVLLDINIKGDDGRQLCWKLKKESNIDVKVILMSGYDYNKGRAVIFGADEILPKPLVIEFLLHKINLLIGHNQDI